MRPYLKYPSAASAEMRTETPLPKALRAVEATAPDAPSSSVSSTPAFNDTPSADDVIDVAEVGKMLRIGRNTIYAMVARNQIPHRRFGRCIRFSRAAIMRWLDPCSLQDAKERQ